MNKGFHNQAKPTISSQPETGLQRTERRKKADRIIPNSEDSIKWSDIWSITKEHNQHAEWLKRLQKTA